VAPITRGALARQVTTVDDLHETDDRAAGPNENLRESVCRKGHCRILCVSALRGAEAV
jgi:hypothetical protein